MGYAMRRRPHVSVFVISPPRLVMSEVTRSVAAVSPSSCSSGVSTNMSSYSRNRHLLSLGMPSYVVLAARAERRSAAAECPAHAAQHNLAVLLAPPPHYNTASPPTPNPFLQQATGAFRQGGGRDRRPQPFPKKDGTSGE